MKTKLLSIFTAVILFIMPNVSFSQAINLGTAANFVLFSTNGAVSNTGISQITGNVGTNNGSSTAFGNVNGVMHDKDGTSAKCAADLLTAYGQLNVAVPTFHPSTLLGNGVILIAGVYAIGAEATLNGDLTLDAKNDPNAVFIFQINGAFSTAANSKIILVNQAKACNVFWKIEGKVFMAATTTMRGTVIVNNAEIIISTGSTLEGRVLTTAGAVTIDGILAYTPVGCNSPVLTGPVAPTLATTECYAIFSATGDVTNTGITNLMGDVGSNVGSTTGFDALKVSGTIHPLPDGSTAQAAADLLVVYNFLNLLPSDIELLFPVQLGNGLVLTPHTYFMNAAALLTGDLTLNAQGNANAVFVIKIKGALTTSTYANVLLSNGAQAKNVYWVIEGAVSINNYSVFCGTIVSHNGALGAINTGVKLHGRALTTAGALTTAAIITDMPAAGCIPTTDVTSLEGNKTNEVVTVYPNPFTTSIQIRINDAVQLSKPELRLYSISGKEVMNKSISKRLTSLETNNLPSGIYFYKLMDNNKIIQSGKLVSR